MPVISLQPAQLRAVCPPENFTFQSTAELPPVINIIGQPRGTRALEFGMGIEGDGYNIFVLGAHGTGRSTAIKHFLQTRTREKATPPDWVYVYNFKYPQKPRAMQLPPGNGQLLQTAMQRLVQQLKSSLAQTFAAQPVENQLDTSQQQTIVASTLAPYLTPLRSEFESESAILHFLEEVEQDILAQVSLNESPMDNIGQLDLRRYAVNLFVDNASTAGAPVIIELDPNLNTLMGHLAYEVQSGALSTHFSYAQSGSLHQANGGYLIIQAQDLWSSPDAWEAIKRALKSGEIRLQTNSRLDGAPVLAKSLNPQPIPLNVKVILLGSLDTFYAFFDEDEEFHTIFKVRADFDATMPRNAENEQAYAQFIAARCHSENLRPFDTTAVARVVEFGARLTEKRNKLSTRFGMVADLVREANYWTGRNGRSIVTAVDVQQALAERMLRANYLEEKLQEEILTGDTFIETSGSVIGQVNGLSTYDTGNYTFGHPNRITGRTFMGDSGVIHIERETQMSGPIHDKGVLILYGYLGGMYAQHQPLSLTASLTFEQNYGGIEGDSASSTELYALLSCLTRTPIKQGIAVTGSVNQHGSVQPIGGVNEKIEGFFKICRERGLTGDQGVIIPASNVEDLMLHEDVITAVAAGKFSIWPVYTVDEGIEILTGVPAGQRDEAGEFPPGSIHYLAQKRLLEMALNLKSFGEKEEDEEEESSD